MKRLAEVPLLAVDHEPAPLRLPEPPPQFGRPADSEVDWHLIVSLRRQASAEIAANLSAHTERTGRPLPELDRRLMGRSVIRSVVREHARQLGDTGKALWSLTTEHAYAQSLENAIFGFGRLQPMFEIPDAENIEIHGFDSVVVQFGDGTRRQHPPVADSDEELIEAIRFLGESANPSRPFDEAHPTVTLALGDRFRLHAIGFGLTYRPAITIRQHTMTHVTLDELADRGMMPADLARLLQAAVRARKSVVISGDQGAGNLASSKTDLSSVGCRPLDNTLGRPTALTTS